MQLFTTLTSGATLVFPPPAQQLSLAELLNLCEAETITVLDLPVALWHQCVSEMKAQDQSYPRALRVCLTGGEKPSIESLRDWATLAEQPMNFLCSYGPTEASITTTIFVTNNESMRNQPPQTHSPGRAACPTPSSIFWTASNSPFRSARSANFTSVALALPSAI